MSSAWLPPMPPRGGTTLAAERASAATSLARTPLCRLNSPASGGWCPAASHQLPLPASAPAAAAAAAGNGHGTAPLGDHVTSPSGNALATTSAARAAHRPVGLWDPGPLAAAGAGRGGGGAGGGATAPARSPDPLSSGGLTARAGAGGAHREPHRWEGGAAGGGGGEAVPRQWLLWALWAARRAVPDAVPPLLAHPHQLLLATPDVLVALRAGLAVAQQATAVAQAAAPLGSPTMHPQHQQQQLQSAYSTARLAVAALVGLLYGLRWRPRSAVAVLLLQPVLRAPAVLPLDSHQRQFNGVLQSYVCFAIQCVHHHTDSSHHIMFSSGVPSTTTRFKTTPPPDPTRQQQPTPPHHHPRVPRLCRLLEHHLTPPPLAT
eukprot:XP_001700622.1 predicted protein [Chlamydomonas reinhardtii]